MIYMVNSHRNPICVVCGCKMKVHRIIRYDDKDYLEKLSMIVRRPVVLPEGKVRIVWKCVACGAFKQTHRKIGTQCLLYFPSLYN